MNAAEIKAAVARYYTKKRMVVYTEVGLNRRGRLRVDCLCLSMRKEIAVVEVKSSPADFKNDKKWHLYRDYCHRMHFAMTKATHDKVGHLIPKGVGVFIASPKLGKNGQPLVGTLRSVQSSVRQDLNEELVVSLLVRMAFRNADFNRQKRA